MKSLKQELVGFHWSAFFEPRLPFTRVPVKLPLPPHPPPPTLPPVSLPPLPHSFFDWLNCPPSSVHIMTLQNQHSSFPSPLSSPFTLWPLTPPPPLLTSLYSVTFSHLTGGGCFSPPPPQTAPCSWSSTPDFNHFKHSCRSVKSQGDLFVFFLFLFLGVRGTKRWRDFYTLLPFLFCCPYNSHL